MDLGIYPESFLDTSVHDSDFLPDGSKSNVRKGRCFLNSSKTLYRLLRGASPLLMTPEETQGAEGNSGSGSLGGDVIGKLQRNLTREGFFQATGQGVTFRFAMSPWSLSQGKHQGLKYHVCAWVSSSVCTELGDRLRGVGGPQQWPWSSGRVSSEDSTPAAGLEAIWGTSWGHGVCCRRILGM